MRRTFILLILSIAPAWAASPVFMFTGTNEMIAAPVPRVNTNLWAVLSGHTNKNDGWGGIFEFVTNNAATIDWTNTFPASVSNARWRRVVQPVGTNAPAQLTVMGKLGVGTQAPDQEAEVNVNQNSDTELRVKNTTSGANAYAGMSLITDNSGTLEMAAFSTDWTSGLASSVARSAMVRSSSLSGGLVLAALGSNPVSIWTDDVKRVNVSSGGVVNIAGLTASRVVATDGSKNLVSVGAPAADGYILSSTTGGTFSWVANAAGSSGGNPTASVGLTAVNGAASTFLRSDGAPALDQGIIPTWTGMHAWTRAATNDYGIALYKGAEATGRWHIEADGTMIWGDGTTITYPKLWRSAPGTLMLEGNLTVTTNLAVSSLTASKPVFTDGSKNLTSTGTVPYANLPIRTLSSQYTQAGNVGSGEDTLMTYTLPGGTLAAAGDRLVIRAGGATGGNGNAKTLTFYFGSGTITLINAATLNSKSWNFSIDIIRKTATTNSDTLVFTYAEFSPGAPTTMLLTQVGASNDTFASDLVIKFTAEATSDNDVTQGTMIIEHHAAP